MRVINADIRPHNSSWSVASTKKFRKEIGRDSVREIKTRTRKTMKETPNDRERERERELGILP